MNKIKSDGGGGANYYDLPKNVTQLQDLIEHRNMNGNIKDIFKACYRMGLKDGTTDDYDMRKMVFYALRELGRIDGRKDYLTLADEVIGHQHEEPFTTGGFVKDTPEDVKAFLDKIDPTLFEKVTMKDDDFEKLLADDRHQENIDRLNEEKARAIMVHLQPDGTFVVDCNGYDYDTVIEILQKEMLQFN